MNNKIVSGMLWRFGERITAQLVSFVVSVLLARILMPEDYGIVAIVNIFIAIANIFVVSGLGTALIQKKDADEVDFSTMFWANLVLSILLYAVLFLCAPLIAAFYDSHAGAAGFWAEDPHFFCEFHPECLCIQKNGLQKVLFLYNNRNDCVGCRGHCHGTVRFWRLGFDRTDNDEFCG